MDALSVTATQDPEGFLGHPVNAFKLMKRLNTEWAELESLVLSDMSEGRLSVSLSLCLSRCLSVSLAVSLSAQCLSLCSMSLSLLNVTLSYSCLYLLFPSVFAHYHNVI